MTASPPSRAPASSSAPGSGSAAGELAAPPRRPPRLRDAGAPERPWSGASRPSTRGSPSGRRRSSTRCRSGRRPRRAAPTRRAAPRRPARTRNGFGRSLSSAAAGSHAASASAAMPESGHSSPSVAAAPSCRQRPQSSRPRSRWRRVPLASISSSPARRGRARRCGSSSSGGTVPRSWSSASASPGTTEMPSTRGSSQAGHLDLVARRRPLPSASCDRAHELDAVDAARLGDELQRHDRLAAAASRAAAPAWASPAPPAARAGRRRRPRAAGRAARGSAGACAARPARRPPRAAGDHLDRRPRPRSAVDRPAQEHLGRHQPARVEVVADRVEEQPVGHRRVGLAQVEARDDHHRHRAGRRPGRAGRELGAERRQDVDAADVDAGRAPRDRLEVVRADQPVAVLQVARRLLLALRDGLGLGAAPGPDRVVDLQAGGQRRRRC